MHFTYTMLHMWVYAYVNQMHIDLILDLMGQPGRQIVRVFSFLFLSEYEGGGDCIRASHTQLHSPGDLWQPVILPCTPPSSLPFFAALCWNRSTTYNRGAMRSKCAPTFPSLCTLTPATSTVQQQKTSYGPLWTHRGWLRRDRQSQPQHADLAATTAIYTATLEQTGFQPLIWNVYVYKTNLHQRHKMLISTNLNEKEKIGICMYCVELFAITNGSSLSVSKGTWDGERQRWRTDKKCVYRDSNGPALNEAP